ncbi:hypothetical protein [Sphingobacterium sp.]|uniref:hypothetical protein n=1 Tax=Sphingobacterium sp. TaxID=341027 RepID=UPI002898AA12|nr:hypothetical protein [Sphingobacterium sp.]
MSTEDGSIEKNMATLLSLEERFNVADWELFGIQLWPIIKHISFFDFKEGYKRKESKNLVKALSVLKEKIKNKIQFFKERSNNSDLSTLPSSDIFFCGANSYFSEWENKNLNKFFDPIIDELPYRSIYFNYSNVDLPNTYQPNRSFNIYSYLNAAKGLLEKRENKISLLREYIYKNPNLDQVLVELSINLKVSHKKLIDILYDKLMKIDEWRRVWLLIIDKVNPKVGVVLCYYDISMYGLILALRERRIPSVDMQHGGQGIGHPAYSYFPKHYKGFNLLPDYFWVWDDVSSENIKRWNKFTYHKVIVGGNPWIRKFMKMKTKNDYDHRYIICTLPADKSYYRLMPDPLLDAISKSSSEYIFGFRFHPKTTKYGKQSVIDIVNKKSLSDRVEFIESNSKPLPYLFSKAWAHISVGSIGSIAEAAIIGVSKNIVLDRIGVKYYSKLIEEGRAFYFDIDSGEDLLSFICRIENSHEEFTENWPSYKSLFDQILK